MKFAERVIDIPNAFDPSPLNDEQLSRFITRRPCVCELGDEYMSPIADICDACKQPSEHNTFLLLGHRGCGKAPS